MKYFDDINVGDHLALGAHTFTAEDIKAFAAQYDPQAFHMDEAAAAKSHFALTRGQLIVPAESCITTLSPTLRSSSCSACSIIRKNATKCIIPAASVSLNSTRRDVTKAVLISRGYSPT